MKMDFLAQLKPWAYKLLTKAHETILGYILR